MTVVAFFDMVFLNEYHNIRVKSRETDKIIVEFNKIKGKKVENILEKEIKEFATDWENHTYILWV